ncbi:prothymosin alpha-A-like [Cynara cardunculus var. scolymus]|uniref:prothymosin alpha-A-like n=1 Tax=Cynara cardunculus var. scolymus TaxID=59895 RepID=UPI000D6235ED|nr:prothymosin alpha-A-like [Cynara cardunculus var. scolymus]
MLATVQYEVVDNTEAVAAIASKAEKLAAFNLLQAEALSNLEHRVKDISSSPSDLTLHLDDEKEGEKDKSEKIAMENASNAAVDEALALFPHADVIPAVKDANKTDEVEAEDDYDVNGGDEKIDDEEEDEDKEPQIPNVGQHLGDDDDDEDDDDFTI